MNKKRKIIFGCQKFRKRKMIKKNVDKNNEKRKLFINNKLEIIEEKKKMITINFKWADPITLI